MLLSLVNKETALVFLIGQPLGGWSRQNRIVGERKQRQADAMALLSEMEVGQNLPGKPRPCGDTQIIRYGLAKM